jgi:hypothetical protein
MAFTVEDGTGVADANAYIDADYFAEYHGDRGRDLTDYANPAIEAAIVKATDYIEQRFGRKFRGYKGMKEQGLEWPRIGAYDDDGYAWSYIVPSQVQKATAEYALIVLQLVWDELLPNPALPFARMDETTGTATGGASGQLVRTLDKVGSLEQEREYAKNEFTSSNVMSKSKIVDDLYIPAYPRADLWVEETLVNSNTTRLGRGD